MSSHESVTVAGDPRDTGWATSLPLGMREIEVFLTLSEELHFGRSAARLLVSTSHVSQVVQRIERRIGGPLFERTSRQVRLTSLGEQLHSQLGPAYRQMREAIERARGMAGGTRDERLDIAFSQAVSSELVTSITSGFERERPGCSLTRSVITGAQQNQVMGADGKLPCGVDALVAWLPSTASGLLSPQLSIVAVIQLEQRAVIMGHDHPLGSRLAIDAEELADWSVLYPFSARFAKAGRFADAWTPPTTPSGRVIPRVQRDVVYIDQVNDALCDGLIHLTVANLTALNWPGTVTVPLTGLPEAALVVIVAAGEQKTVTRAFARYAAKGSLMPAAGLDQ